MEAHYFCWNGPKKGTVITEAPVDARPGHACAVPWLTVGGRTRYAVYVLQEYQGRRGLLYIKSYDTPSSAQMNVERITRTMATPPPS